MGVRAGARLNVSESESDIECENISEIECVNMSEMECESESECVSAME